MLKNLKLRTKLAVVLLVPLVALVAISAVGVRDRWDDAAAARKDKQVTELLAARVELTHQLQVERIWLSLTGSTAVAQQLEANGSLLRTARTDYEQRAAAVRSVDPVLQRAIDDAAARLAELDAARPTGGRVATQGSVTAYDTALEALGRVGVVAARAGGTAARLDRASMVDLAGLKSGYATLAARSTLAINAGLPAAQLEPLRQQVLVLDEQERSFLATASPESRAVYEEQTAASATASTTLARFLSTGSDRVVPADKNAWINDAVARLTALRQVEAVLTNSVGQAAASAEADAAAAARNAALVVTAVVLLTLLVASLIARSIARPITRLTAAANMLADERLPALVEQMRRPDAATPHEPVPLPIGSKDEVGQLARALDKIQGVTRTVADEQAVVLRKGIGDIFVNLARRNQTLLDRQIEFLDQLEAAEEDPDVLQDLFKLDHLATRMRRNAESLLVLAGAEPPRRRGRPVDMADVVRVAVGEVEHFARVQLRSLDDATVAGSVAVDVAHLLSELMENATQFSPPETSVEVTGARTATGDYHLVVADQGIGMTAEQLADANDLISHPPPVGLSISRSLGFTVIGRLAERHTLTVHLEASPGGGVRATVALPAALLDPAPSGRAASGPPLTSRHTPAASMAMATPATPAPADGDLPLFGPASSGPTPPPALPPAMPAAETTPPTVTPPRPVPPVPATWDAPAPAAPAPSAAAASTALTAPAVPPAPALPSPPTAEQPDAPGAPLLARRPVVRPGAASTPSMRPVAPPPAPSTAPAGEQLPTPVAPPTVHAAPPAPAPAPPPAEGPAAAPLPRRAPAAELAPEGLPRRTPTADVAPEGLPVRTPAAARAPGAPGAAGAPAADAPSALEGLTQRVPRAEQAAARPATSAARASQRSPEEVRDMLSRYRSGLKKGRTEDDAPPAGPPA
jgi:signal transduction histidine kinase